MADNQHVSIADQHSLARVPDNIAVCFLPKAENLSQRGLKRGLNYFTQGFIHKIRVSDRKSGAVRVDAKCWRSMQKNQPPHQLQIEISSSSAKIDESFCSCKAGLNGHCSHIIGLIKSLQGLKLHNFTHVPDQQSCTSVPQQWHMPRGEKIKPVPLNHVVVAKPSESKKRKPVICHFDVDYRLPEVTNTDMSHLQSLTGTPLANLTTNVPTANTPIGDVYLGSVLSYQTRNLKKSQPAAEHRCGDPSVNGKAPINLPGVYQHLNKLDENFDVQALEIKTRAQSESADWFAARSERLTSSNFGKVMKRKAQPTTKFLESIFSVSSVSAAPLEYGKRNEKHAKAKYLQEFPQKHLHDCGLVVNKEFDFLGASPDGRVCDGGKSGIIEIKCPYRSRNMSVLQACEQFRDFYLQLGSDKIPKLSKSHEYYAQVQGQLMITGSQFCEFIVYTNSDLHVERVLPDLQFMENMLSKLAEFYHEHALSFLSNRQTSS